MVGFLGCFAQECKIDMAIYIYIYIYIYDPIQKTSMNATGRQDIILFAVVLPITFYLHNGRITEGERKVVTLVIRMLVLSSS